MDFPSQLKLLPTYELRSKLSHIPTLDDFDMDENYVQSINSKSFDISDFSKLNITSIDKHFSIFHVNTRSLSKNFDQLQSVLSGLGLVFDLIGITETKQQMEKDFITNVDINDYHLYTQHSKGAAGGVAIYANNKLDHFRRKDLDTVNDEFESI